MPEKFERIFPDAQCLSEEIMSLAEVLTGEDIVRFFKVHGPVWSGKATHVHVESPFTTSYGDVQRLGISYNALHEHGDAMADLRAKLAE